jgi:NAD(P)-dependent dehydrogenase (short-subunit alcohol dehydrogenase family)
VTVDDRLFLITGATGKTGGGAADLLLRRGHRVRAVAHREDERSRALARAGAEVVVADVLGHPVHYEPLTVGEFTAAMLKRGLPAHLVQHFSHVALDYQHGVFAGTNDVVEKIGGEPPLSVAQFVTMNKADFDTSGPNFVPAP